MAILAVVAVWWPLPVLQHDGWPTNHDEFAPFLRIEGFRRAFAAGQWYPLWTPFCQWGHGSPYPLFYPRLYPTLGAIFALASGSVLTAVKLLTVVMLFAGGAGMRRLLRVSGATEPLAVAGGILFIAAPYTLTDWLVRGATAEFMGMMLLPWAYAELCFFRRGQRHWVRLALAITVLFHAHSLVCYIFLVSAVCLLASSLVGPGRSTLWHGIGAEWRQVSMGGLILVLGIGLHLVVVAGLTPYFHTDRLNAFLVEADFQSFWRNFAYHSFWRYFSDDTFASDTIEGINLEMNRFVWVALIGLHLLPGGSPRWRGVLRVPLYPFFAGCVAVTLILQRPALAFVFRLLPMAGFIQYPWRLLTLMTVGAIFLLVAAAQAGLRGGRYQQIIVLVAISLTVILSVSRFATYRYVPLTLPSGPIQYQMDNLDGPVSMGEYLLKDIALDGTAQPLTNGPFIQPQGCEPRLHVLEDFDQRGAYAMMAKVDAPCRILIRQLQTPLLELRLENATLLSKTPSKEFLVELQPGQSVVRLRPRTFWEMVARTLTRADAG